MTFCESFLTDLRLFEEQSPGLGFKRAGSCHSAEWEVNCWIRKFGLSPWLQLYKHLRWIWIWKIFLLKGDYKWSLVKPHYELCLQNHRISVKSVWFMWNVPALQMVFFWRGQRRKPSCVRPRGLSPLPSSEADAGRIYSAVCSIRFC